MTTYGLQITPLNVNLSFYPHFVPPFLLLFRNIRDTFATQKRTDMFTIAQAYAEFSKMLLEDRIYEDPSISFEDICAAMRVSAADLDHYLSKELGMNGREILYYFQKLLNLQTIA